MKNAILLFGGKSFEHDISIITALTIYNRAKETSYNILPVYVSKSNEWFFYAKEKMHVSHFKNFEESWKKNGFKKIYFIEKNMCFEKVFSREMIPIDCVLNCCHGGMGENGDYISFFNVLKIPISSGCSLGHKIGMDKISSKIAFKALNLPVVNYFVFTKQEFMLNKELIRKKIEKLQYPIILKPALLGSSIGIKIANNFEEFIPAALTALEFDDKILVEKAILENMREYNVACLKKGNKLVISEIDKPIRKDIILSFKDKYIGDKHIDSTNTYCKNGNKNSGAYLSKINKNLDLSNKMQEKIKMYAKRICLGLDLFGPIRIDFIVDNKNKIYVNEINTVPGSLAYYFFVPSVYKCMSEYVDDILKNAEKIYESENNIKKEFITKLI